MAFQTSRKLEAMREFPTTSKSKMVLIAILKAILAAEYSKEAKVVILTDSLVGCKLISNCPRDNYIVHLIRDQIDRMLDKQFMIQWIPSHVGIHGNEEADDFAMRGCFLETVYPLLIIFADMMVEVKNIMLRNWNEYYQFTSQSKGAFHFGIQDKISTKPCLKTLV